ncbi:MBL fold metallo-hydrolase [Actinokineospora globicatena]|uniref:MBL fold hydrolase n=1 Tax=Actinokineospora globicatena TaxID=103729 RepID=A0A9W6QK89_9PSEU|nr:MBL fold metallo-hydrolase [Actinokineospora globicatena]GLW90039.1 MBL fold hydrolase [Actinokineospora globicatena]
MLPATPVALNTPDATIWFVPDGNVELASARWFSDLDAHPDHRSDLVPAGPYLPATIGATLVRPHGAGPTVLIDAGLGPVRAPRPPRGDSVIGAVSGGALLDNLATIGVRPADIDLICFTHLDDDHIGWVRHSAALASIPLVVAGEEWDWAPPRKRAELAARNPVRLVPAGGFAAPPVFSRAAVGHTPGHCVYLVGDPPSAVVTGDALHWHTQVAHHRTRVTVDADPDAAVRTRGRLITDLARLGVPAVTAHLWRPVGRVVATGDTYRWEPIDGRP